MLKHLNRVEKWRLLLGQDAEASEEEQSLDQRSEAKELDRVLEELYGGKRTGGMQNSNPKINRWLADIRRYFPSSVVQVLQRDAFERLNLKRLLLEPELLKSFEPDLHLVANLLSLKQNLPARSQDLARQLVQELVDALRKKLQMPLQQAIRGALSQAQRKYRPKLQEINWPKTIGRNLKHYQPEYQSIIPHELIGYGRKRQGLKDLILCVDQSGSMSSSVIYAAVLASVLAKLPSLNTKLLLFDTQVYDMTEALDDPVELLFGLQLGGGTHIYKALAKAQSLVERPADTILVLLSDLYEGGSKDLLIAKMAELVSSAVQCISLLALDDEGKPAYDRQVADGLSKLGIPVFACTPDRFPNIMAAALRKEDLRSQVL